MECFLKPLPNCLNLSIQKNKRKKQFSKTLDNFSSRVTQAIYLSEIFDIINYEYQEQ